MMLLLLLLLLLGIGQRNGQPRGMPPEKACKDLWEGWDVARLIIITTIFTRSTHRGLRPQYLFAGELCSFCNIVACCC
uniref:Putative secreted protein n=1 Tax=Anopheles darlingi TaxID=43151 RepID=A0A2M4D1A7_ANODA